MSAMKLRFASIGVAIVALVLLGRMAVFMVDADQTQLSIEPTNQWRTQHSCLSAYAEAARLAGEPGVNIYDRKLYENRFIAGLKVDAYEYPPPFLLLPDGLQRISGGYLELRPVWFALQLALLGLALWMIVRWVGDKHGRAVLLASPLFFVAPATVFTLQMGNLQLTATALSVIAIIALASSRAAVQALGGLALAYAALSKVFPGILFVYLAVTRRWRALAWAVGAAFVLTAIALAVYGTRPFDDFIHYQLPRLSSGEAFPQSEFPRVAATNMSFYGLLVKLRALGVEGLDQPTGLALGSVYGVIVIGLAIALAWRRRMIVLDPGSRLGELAIWLAVVNLAAMRSPFVGGAYGVLGTTFLTLLMACGAQTLRARIGWWLAFALMFVGGVIVPTPRDDVTQSRIAAALALHVALLGINAWVCASGLRRARQPILANA